MHIFTQFFLILKGEKFFEMFKYANRTIEIEFGPVPECRHYHPRYRAAGLKFNPYVGTFHYCGSGPNFSADTNISNVSNVTRMKIQNDNPLLPFFRHSPPIESTEKPFDGVKEVIAKGKSVKTPVIVSQLDVNKVLTHSFKLKTMMRYSSRASDCSLSSYEDFSNEPRCAICLEEYIDGDEIFTLSCSHCFHKDCINCWLHQTCSDRNEQACSFPCPKCRHEHVVSDVQMHFEEVEVDYLGREERENEHDTIEDAVGKTPNIEEDNQIVDTPYIGLDDLVGGKALVYGYVDLDVDNLIAEDMGISIEAFKRMGQYQYDEGGYDFLSDIDLTESSHADENKNQENSDSEYSMCGRAVEKSVIE